MDYKNLNAEEFDAEIAKNTGFKSMNDLLTAKGTYRPSCDVDNPFHLELADRFDLEMKRMGLEHRAYRYGRMSAVAKLIKADKRIMGKEANSIRRLLAGRH